MDGIRSIWLLVIFCLVGSMPIALAQTPAKTYAQKLVEDTLAKHPEVTTLALHVTPPNSPDNIIIASNFGRIGKKADEADLKVIQTGKPTVEINKSGDRLSVELPLHDVGGNTIGALAVALPYKAGDDKRKLQKQAEKIRDEVSKRITYVANLVETAQFDTSIPSNTYAQQLVDQALQGHPEVIILALHVRPPDGKDNVIIASNFGRIGKKADEDDMKVVDTGVPILEVNKNGDRFEAEIALQNVSGERIGALSVVFPYKSGEDKAKFQQRAEKIGNELRRRITYAANLLEPADWNPQVPKHTYAQRLVDETLAKHPEVLILAIHATPPNVKDTVIIASNIGRIGKKADDDDMKVVETGTPNLEVNKNGDRFEAEIVLQDASGKPIGALSVVFPYKSGDDKTRFQQMAEKVRDEMREKTPTLGRLFEPAP
jgi:RNase H-fold protein (predicted Holliday junction resolvase)